MAHAALAQVRALGLAARGREDLGAGALRHGQRGQPHAAGRGMDEHALSGPQARHVLERVERGHVRERQRRRLREGQPGRLAHDQVLRDRVRSERGGRQRDHLVARTHVRPRPRRRRVTTPAQSTPSAPALSMLSNAAAGSMPIANITSRKLSEAALTSISISSRSRAPARHLAQPQGVERAGGAHVGPEGAAARGLRRRLEGRALLGREPRHPAHVAPAAPQRDLVLALLRGELRSRAPPRPRGPGRRPGPRATGAAPGARATGRARIPTAAPGPRRSSRRHRRSPARPRSRGRNGSPAALRPPAGRAADPASSHSRTPARRAARRRHRAPAPACRGSRGARRPWARRIPPAAGAWRAARRAGPRRRRERSRGTSGRRARPRRHRRGRAGAAARRSPTPWRSASTSQDMVVPAEACGARASRTDWPGTGSSLSLSVAASSKPASLRARSQDGGSSRA